MGIATFVSDPGVTPDSVGNKKQKTGIITLSSSYAGESIDTSGNTVTFVASADTITRTTGSWLTSGIKVGDTITITDSSSNDGQHVVSAITALVLTVGNTTADETATTVIIIFAVTIGGDAFDFKTLLGLARIDSIVMQSLDGRYTFVPDLANNRILVYDNSVKLSQRFTYWAAAPAAATVYMWRAPFAGDITDVIMSLGVCGTGAGPTEIDVNKGIGGTSIFTTEPSIAHDDTDGSEDNGTINAAADDFALGDIIELVIDAVSTGSADNMTVTIELTGTGQPAPITDLSAITAEIKAIGH